MSNPIRPGARGGRDQFSWEKVKEDRQRINYLGSSIHGLPDKFKKGPETFWYAKESKTIPSSQDKTEIESIKEKEKLAMEALLGKSVKPVHSENYQRLTENEVKKESSRDYFKNESHHSKRHRNERSNRRNDLRSPERFGDKDYNGHRRRDYYEDDGRHRQYRRDRDYESRSQRSENYHGPRRRSRSPNYRE